VGTYRGAAAICGTTHKTVKRIVEKHNGDGVSPERKERGHNYLSGAGHLTGYLVVVLAERRCRQPFAQPPVDLVVTDAPAFGRTKVRFVGPPSRRNLCAPTAMFVGDTPP
jgi:hypothetical protein